jgi:hypothetical protein
MVKLGQGCMILTFLCFYLAERGDESYNHSKSGLYTPFVGNPHTLVETFRRNVSTTRKEKVTIRADLVSLSAATGTKHLIFVYALS